jgi:hypothetical protein
MPIKVACKCGAAFAAKDELAGRTVACPKCKQPLKIQAAQPAAAAAPAAPHANADLFDGLGLKARDESVPRCPGCNADMPANAVLCVKCGYNVKLGRRMQTISMSNEGPAVAEGGGHGAGVTSMLMARAAAAAEEDEVAEKSKTKVGLPLWVLIVGLFCCILFGVVMSLIPQHIALQGTGWLLLSTSFMLVLFAWVGIVVMAFIKNPIYGLAVIFADVLVFVIAVCLYVFIDPETLPREVTIFALMLIGIGSTIYAYTDGENCAKFMVASQIAYVLRVVGLILLVIGWIVGAFSKEDQAQRSDPVPRMVTCPADAEVTTLATPMV